MLDMTLSLEDNIKFGGATGAQHARIVREIVAKLAGLTYKEADAILTMAERELLTVAVVRSVGP